MGLEQLLLITVSIVFGLCTFLIRSWLKDVVKIPVCDGKERLIKEKLDKEKQIRELRDEMLERKFDELKETFERKADEQHEQNDQLIGLMGELVIEVKNGNKEKN